MSHADILLDTQTMPEVEIEKLPPTIQQLTEILAAPEKHVVKPTSRLEHWFWLIVVVGLVGVPFISVGMMWLWTFINGPQAVTSANPPLNVGEIIATGPTDLCPGESLNFSFDMDVVEAGAFELDMSTWREDPPSTVIFSEADNFVVAEPIKFLVERRWVVPGVYTNPATGETVNWESGKYARHVYVTAIGRNTLASIQKLSFTIRPDCNK